MNELDLTSEQFLEIGREILQKNGTLTFRARGKSMRPFIRDGDFLMVESCPIVSFRVGDVILFNPGKDHLLVHRIIKIKRSSTEEIELLVQGDALRYPDGWIRTGQVLGRVAWLERNSKKLCLNRSWIKGFSYSYVTMLRLIKPILIRLSWLFKEFNNL
jgi:signal peptidase I